MAEVYKLFDIATPDLVALLEKDRILGNVGGCAQDIAFYRDQKGPRLGHMGKVDTEFALKKLAAAKRKLSTGPAAAATTSIDSRAAEGEDTASGPEETTEDSTDVNFNPTVKRSKTVLVEFPRNLLAASPAITSALDRNKSSNIGALETSTRDFGNTGLRCPRLRGGETYRYVCLMMD